jgi:hypothetical protein
LQTFPHCCSSIPALPGSSQQQFKQRTLHI